MSGWDVSSTPTWGSQDGPEDPQTDAAAGSSPLESEAAETAGRGRFRARPGRAGGRPVPGPRAGTAPLARGPLPGGPVPRGRVLRARGRPRAGPTPARNPPARNPPAR